MSTSHLDNYVTDSTSPETLAGRGSVTLVTLGQLLLSHTKIIGMGYINPVRVYFLPNVPKYVFQVLQVLQILTGGGFQTGAINADGTLKCSKCSKSSVRSSYE